MKATALIAFATAFLAAASLRTANAADDIDVKEGTGDVIGEIADVVSNFQLTDLPANLYIEADSMTFDYEGGKLTYQGDVEVASDDGLGNQGADCSVTVTVANTLGAE